VTGRARGSRGGRGSADRSDGREGALLLELADFYGVLPSYLDGVGVERSPSPEALIAVLRALGAPLDGMRDVGQAVESARQERDGRLAPPAVAAWEGDDVELLLRLPRSGSARRVECRLQLEDGEAREWQAEVNASRLAIAGELPLGVHELSLRVAGREARSWIIRAPRTTWDPWAEEGSGEPAAGARNADRRLPSASGAPRDFGLFLPLHALRSARSWGIGDLTDLAALVEWSAAHGAGFVGTLPLMAAFLDPGSGPYEPGPYTPVSRLFWNEIYLDVERAVAAEGREPPVSGPLTAEAARLRDTPRVRYAEVMALKRRVLEALVEDVAPASQPLPGPLLEYAAQRPDVTDYAHFRAVGERLATPWSEWPSALRDGRLDPDPRDAAAFRYHLYVQRAFEAQLEGLAAANGHPRAPTLYLDLPLGTHREGYDVWRWRDAFALDLAGGAPPDAFFAGGQNWRFPPLHPQRAREDGHAYLRRALAHVMRPAGMLRLDHVMSLHRLYCVPAGHDANDGAYVRYPAEELYAVLCLESHRWKCELVGEDLGTVTPEVHDAMESHGLRRMYVVPFELEGGGSDAPRLRAPAPLSVASVGTHDLPPFASFWSGDDIVRRERSGQLSPAQAADERVARAKWRADLHAALGLEPRADTFDALRAALRFLATSRARHVLVNVEDLWLETEPQNVPGTSSDRNWTLKARRALEEWARVPRLEETLSEVERARAARNDEAWTQETHGRKRQDRMKGSAWAS
jgi:4-alpha-glucanotransferase